jgi:hypothetical protein
MTYYLLHRRRGSVADHFDRGAPSALSAVAFSAGGAVARIAGPSADLASGFAVAGQKSQAAPATIATQTMVMGAVHPSFGYLRGVVLKSGSRFSINMALSPRSDATLMDG